MGKIDKINIWQHAVVQGHVTGRNVILSRNICCKCWQTEIEVQWVLPTVKKNAISGEDLVQCKLIYFIKNTFMAGYKFTHH